MSSQKEHDKLWEKSEQIQAFMHNSVWDYDNRAIFDFVIVSIKAVQTMWFFWK